MSRKTNSLDNIMSNTIRDYDSGCLLYMGRLDEDGYARISWQGKNRIGSDAVYELVYGTIPAGHEVDHICHIRRCVEPTHLRALTHRQNVIQRKSYVEIRHQRVRTFIDAYPQAEFFPVLIDATRLRQLWGCKGGVRELLQTMCDAFPQEFVSTCAEEARGRRSALYTITIKSSLIARLLQEHAERTSSTEKTMTLVV
jgi:HNH endonuclease